ncbi:MAG: hypothetical protein ABIB98_03680 [bacterium]
MNGRRVWRFGILLVFILVFLFLFHYCSASLSAVSILPEFEIWCEKTGSGTEILLFLPQDMTWAELERELGFGNEISVGILSMVVIWNDMSLPLDRNIPIGKGVLKGCYYWAYLRTYDLCFDTKGDLAVCEVEASWIPICPGKRIRWRVPGLFKSLAYA